MSFESLDLRCQLNIARIFRDLLESLREKIREQMPFSIQSTAKIYLGRLSKLRACSKRSYCFY